MGLLAGPHIVEAQLDSGIVIISRRRHKAVSLLNPKHQKRLSTKMMVTSSARHVWLWFTHAKGLIISITLSGNSCSCIPDSMRPACLELVCTPHLSAPHSAAVCAGSMHSTRDGMKHNANTSYITLHLEDPHCDAAHRVCAALSRHHHNRIKQSAPSTPSLLHSWRGVEGPGGGGLPQPSNRFDWKVSSPQQPIPSSTTHTYTRKRTHTHVVSMATVALGAGLRSEPDSSDEGMRPLTRELQGVLGEI